MTMRISGLSTGIDTEAWVKDLMKAQRVPLDKIYQKKTLLEWKKEDYTKIYKNVSDFRNSVFNYKLQGTLNPHKVTSTAESVATATANGDAANIDHALTVMQLAEGVKTASTSKLAEYKSTLAEQFGLGEDLNIQVNGKTVSVSKDASMYELVSKINSAGADVQANYDVNLNRFFLSSTKTGTEAKIDFSGTAGASLNFLRDGLKLDTLNKASSSAVTEAADSGVKTLKELYGLPDTFDYILKVNNTSVHITQDTTLDALATAINDAAGVTASYDAANKIFNIKAEDGAAGAISFTGSSQEALNLLKNNLKINTNEAVGKDAIVNIDGLELTQSANNFTVSGVSYNIKSVGSTNVVVSFDTDKAVENVKSFIDSYNKLLSEVNAKVREPRKFNKVEFMPLTQEQRDSMKEDEIKRWEEKAHSGLLQRDSILQELQTKMRSNLSSPVQGLTGDYTTAASIGITTGLWKEEGKLYLDETKLRKALEKDPTVISKMFATDGADAEHDGIAFRLYDTLKNTMDKLNSEAGVALGDYDTQSAMAKQIEDYQKRSDDLTRRLSDLEKRYYRQFDAMEAALNRINQQSGWLMQQFGGGQQ